MAEEPDPDVTGYGAHARMRAHEEVHLRIAGDRDAILYDLGGWDRQAVVIRKDGLSLAQPDRDGSNPDARAVACANFYRSEPMMPAEYAPIRVERILPDAINRLWRYVPVRSQEERALVIGWLVGAMLPRLPEYPLLAIRGEWDAAKSSAMARLHQLIDPHAWVKRTNLSDGRAIYMASHSSWVVSWDNVRRLSQDASDALAAMSTGAVYNRRELQTTFRETALSALRPILLCGIGDFLVEPDLLSRALLVELPTLDASAMVDTETLNTQWRNDAPAIRMALFTLAQRVLARQADAMNGNYVHRFATWEKYARLVVDDVCGDGSFRAALVANRQEQAATVGDTQGLTSLLVSCIRRQRTWKGTTADLYKMLALAATDAMKQSQDWPKSVDALGKWLATVSPHLAAWGVRYETRPSNGRRMKMFTWVGEEQAVGDEGIECEWTPSVCDPSVTSDTFAKIAWDETGSLGGSEVTLTGSRDPQNSSTELVMATTR